MNGVSSLNESTIEEAALAYLEDLGWGIAHGPDIAPETTGSRLISLLLRKIRIPDVRMLYCS